MINKKFTVSKRECASVMRVFNDRCIACKHQIENRRLPNTTQSICNLFHEPVTTFGETCLKFEPSKKLKSINNWQIQYLLQTPLFK